jgi:hypothetical protein
MKGNKRNMLKKKKRVSKRKRDERENKSEYK